MSTSLPLSNDRYPRLASRGDLTAYLANLAATLGADSYMLIAVAQDRDRSQARVIASNWVYDAIQLVGPRALAAIANGMATASPGQAARAIALAEAPHSSTGVDGETAKLLQIFGHAELYSLRIHAGRQRYFLLVSSNRPEAIDEVRLARLHMPVCYVLSSAPDLLATVSLVDPLTDRERECMHWVSEGKTTDEIATILSVSANTANSYITNAIQKLGSDNRAMAMATAIRSGVI